MGYNIKDDLYKSRVNGLVKKSKLALNLNKKNGKYFKSVNITEGYN